MLAKSLKFDVETTASLKEAFLKPCPRVTEGQILLENGVRAAIDISDGLVADLGHLCQAGHVAARIEIARIPIQPAVKLNFGNRALELALSGGEDFELLFTASAEIIDRVGTAVSCPVTIIGEITDEKEGGVTLVDSEGNMVSPNSTGWEHFKTN
jgi:thiamine-monophosphate kinase